MGSELQIGTRVYYTGDMANCEGYGNVVATYVAPKGSPETFAFDVLFDDGRTFARLSLHNFTPGPGRRFWIASEWDADRQRRLEAMRREYRARTAKAAAC